MFKVEIQEPDRVILKNDEDQSYVTIAIHESDKEGLEGIAQMKVGEAFQIDIKPEGKEEAVDDEKEALKDEVAALKTELAEVQATLDKAKAKAKSKDETLEKANDKLEKGIEEEKAKSGTV